MNTLQPTEYEERIEPQYASAKYIAIERRTVADTVFLVDDIPFRSAMPKPTHWSIAWSDVMMTMFVLFLSMYVYKTADQDFLNRPALEIVGGDTTEALESNKFSVLSPPITPIAPGLPIMTGGSIGKVETIDLHDIDLDSRFSSVTDHTKIEKEMIEVPADRVIPPQPEPGLTHDAAPQEGTITPTPQQEMAEPDSALPVSIGKPNKIEELYRLSKSAVESNNLNGFAAVDLIGDTAMRITLTSDLLFATGQATLSKDVRAQMEQLATAIQTTPYMINVVGHTDNVPMYSERYASNWELSVAQASTVARFLIEDMGMNPNQFVISGYASYRPLVPNSNAGNRHKNRRVEVIISKRLPDPVSTDRQRLR